MSQQTWSLSQDANKSSGVCSVCRATRQLHLKDGTLHRHGPRDSPCPGSNKPPLSIVANNSGQSHQSQPAQASATQSAPAKSASNTASQPSIWSPASSPLIKHIPKSARPACASHLAKLLRQVTAQPGVTDHWLSVLNWSAAVLGVPKRGGKKHNVTSTVQKRIASFPTMFLQRLRALLRNAINLIRLFWHKLSQLSLRMVILKPP